ncbi:uncharacterized protein LOC105902421 isoform X1 [Clupea harengus]|uniref:Uncharacterized protein LOC105902421 isoform X1 n=1 Tax=Clupea harengus TaxID=7950 RepID=A0A6P8GC02_CLUHA|nr:uncharacterized protein LOC105902421 isoform X1 [Clupea harengus]
MSFCGSPGLLSTGTSRALPPSLLKLRQLLEDKLLILQETVSADRQVCEESDAVGDIRKHLDQSQELRRHLAELQSNTEQEISTITQQLGCVVLRRERISCELADLQRQHSEVQSALERNRDSDTCATLLQQRRELQVCIAGRAAQRERVCFREQALRALQGILSADAHRYQQETQKLHLLSHRASSVMPGESQNEPDNMDSLRSDSRTATALHSEALTNGHTAMGANAGSPGSPGSAEDEDKRWRASKQAASTKGSTLTRSGSVKDLIHKFSVPDSPISPMSSPEMSPSTGPLTGKAPGAEPGGPGGVPEPSRPAAEGQEGEREKSPQRSSMPSVTVTVTPPTEESSRTDKQSETTGPSNGALAGSGTKVECHFDSSKQPESPSSEEEAPSAKASQNPKYQLYMSGEALGNGSRDPEGLVGESGPRTSRWESSRQGTSNRGSMESLLSRDWDTMSDRVGGFESPPLRVFNSPYTSSLDFNPIHRMSEYKVQDGLSPATDFNIFGLNGRSTSPVTFTNVHAPRARYTSTYDTLTRRRERETAPNQVSLRSGMSNKRDYIEELTKQLEEVQRRNQFLEAESIEMDKERNQIRFEMRGLLVNNEDLVRNNTQLQGEMKKMRDRMVEVESDHNVMVERFRQMEGELKEAREVMVEANTQEYAFNFLQQSLKNKIQDAEDALDKQTQHAQVISEKLWLAERKLEELEVDKETRGKKNSELNSSVQRLEDELAEALQTSTQASVELSLQQKLRADAQLRVEELEESLLEKNQEMLRLQQIIHRLQGEVSGKLIDKEQSLEEEIQLRERIQLQCKQAERHVEDLQMEIHTAKQAREDLVKQLKSTQERIIDLESDLEEMHDSEQRWASKHKRVLEQTEQLQLRLIQEKDLSDQLECEKAIFERQVKDLRLEVEDLQISKVQEDVVSKAESKVKELENTLRAEERSKTVLANTANKLERRINELTDQLEEEHRIATEQRDLMTQRLRSMKRQLNDVEEEASRKEAQQRHTQRELTEERETSQRLQRQLLDQHLQLKRKESLMMKQTLGNLRLDLSVDEEDGPAGSTAI